MTDIKTTHTPGPWEWLKPQNWPNFDGRDCDLGGFYAANGAVEIMSFGNNTTYYPSEGCPPSVENARLIAAAPDLLSALREAVEFHDDEDNETIARWRAAIAKAEGNT